MDTILNITSLILSICIVITGFNEVYEGVRYIFLPDMLEQTKGGLTKILASIVIVLVSIKVFVHT